MTRFMEFGELFLERINEGALVAVVVVHFIAMLELPRESLLDITQAEPYAPIYVRLAYASAGRRRVRRLAPSPTRPFRRIS